MTRHDPKNPFAKTIAAIAGVVAIGMFVASQGLAPAGAVAQDEAADDAVPALPRAGYFPAQFGLRPAADEPADPIPTFQEFAMETREFNGRSIRSVGEALVLASGAIATAFGIAAVALMIVNAVRAIAGAF